MRCESVIQVSHVWPLAKLLGMQEASRQTHEFNGG